MLSLILDIARKTDEVRAVVMNGSRVNPNAKKDPFQDYDIIYFVRDVEPFIRNWDFIRQFGEMRAAVGRLLGKLPPELKDDPERRWRLSDGFTCLVTHPHMAPEEIESLFKTVASEFDGLDIFINNAASGFNRPAMQQRVVGWDWTMNVNARAFLFAAQAAVPLMEKRGGGYIVAITSPGSQRVLPDYVVVGASKAALEAVTRYLAVELSSRNIVVNAISPGMVLTDALRHFDALRQDEQIVERATKLTPAGRLVTPEDIAGVAAFLCSPEASMIRGQVIVIDGGYALPIQGVQWDWQG